MEINVIHAEVVKREIRLAEYVPPTAGNVDHDQLEIALDKDWDGLNYRVTFYREGMEYTLPWDGENALTVPWEVLREPGGFAFTVVGSENGTDRLVTKAMPKHSRVKVSVNGEDEGVEPSEPTMDAIIRVDRLAARLEGESDRIAGIADGLESSEGARQDAFDAAQASRNAEFSSDQESRRAEFAADQESRAEEYSEAKEQWQADFDAAASAASKAVAKANASAKSADDAAYSADAAAKGARIAADYASKAKSEALEAADAASKMAGLAEDGYAASMNAAGNAKYWADYAYQMGNAAHTMGNAAKEVADDIAQRAEAGEFNGRPFRIDYTASSVEALPTVATDGQMAVIQSDVEDEDNAKLFIWRSNEKLIDNQPLIAHQYAYGLYEYHSENVPVDLGSKYKVIVHDGIVSDKWGDQLAISGGIYAVNGHPKGAPDDYVVSGDSQIDGFSGATVDGQDVYVEYTADPSRLPFDRWEELYFKVFFGVQANITVIKKGAGWAYLTDMSGASGIEGPPGAAGHTPVKGVDYFTDADKAEIVASVDLTDYVKSTDWASSNASGVIKISSAYGTGIKSNGYLYGATRTLEKYLTDGGDVLISKGTLENALASKGYITAADVPTDDHINELIDGKTLLTSGSYGTTRSNNGYLNGVTKTAEQYNSGDARMFVCKGTLDNVLAERLGAIENGSY